MNNDLENLYGNNNDINNNVSPNNNETINNNVVNEPTDLSSLYGNNNVMQVNEPITEDENNIGVNQEGLNKLYNQNTIDLEAEPTNNGTGPVVIKHKDPSPRPVIKNEYVIEEDLLVAYVGNNFEKIASQPFNFAAFFLNVWYLFYRKRIVYGIIYAILYIVLSTLINPVLVSFGLALIVGVAFNGIYMKEAKSKVQKIKQQNPSKTMAEIRDICKQKGGTSYLSLLIGIVIQIVVSIIIIVIVGILGLTLNITKLGINELTNKTTGTDKQGTYAGILTSDTDIVIKNEYEIEIPTNYKEGMFNESYEYNYETPAEEGEILSSCTVDLEKVLYFIDSKDFIRQMSKYNLKKEQVEEIEINNIKWYYFSKTDDDKITYYYATNKGKDVYLYTYESKTTDLICLANKDNILNSIKSK